MLPAVADDWPQWRGPERDGVWRETGIVETFAGPTIPHVWRAEVSNGYAGPTVADGRVYVTDRVRDPDEAERVLCFDAATGKPLWIHTYECAYRRVGYPDGPRASVTIYDGIAYALGTMGHLRALDAATGDLLWKRDPETDYDVETPIWGIAAAPLVEGDLLIAQLGARPDACLVALDRRTGEERWRALTDKASYSAPIAIDQNGKRLIVCWTGDNIAGLEAKTGAVVWKHPIAPAKMIINVATPVLAGNRLFLTSFYDGSYMFNLPSDANAIEPVWARQGKSERDTDALHSTIGTPVIQGEYIYGVDSYGEFRCLDAKTGDRVWEDLSAVPVERWATIHMVRNGDRIWMFNDQGELIIARLSPKGLEQLGRAQLIAPTTGQLDRGAGVSWSHPAYANKHVFIRNDNELICANLAAN
jgi:outer membrane protein assembly factor BamB